MLSCKVLTLLGYFAAYCSAVGLVDWAEEEVERYVTEPGIRSFIVSSIVRSEEEHRISQDYVFYAPFPRSYGRGVTWIGPHILDSQGQLVWWGNASTGGRTQNLQPCSYLSAEKDHLCWSEAQWTALDYVNGTNHIVDNTYTAVAAPYSAAGTYNFPNPHEMKTTLDGTTLLNCVYETKVVDLTPYNGAKEGYVQDGCFQEVDVETREAVFEWCGLDVLELWHSYIFLDIPENVANHTGEPYGKGTIRKPWDYFHINSVDKDHEGNYVVSARHLNQVIKVAGLNSTSGKPPGALVWRLGGKFNDFTGADMLDLSRQHHVTLVEAKDGLETYSVFNNHWEASSHDRRISNGQIFTLDTTTMTVLSTQKYYSPEGTLSLAQGSAQVLSNGNMLVGWGTVPQVTEFAPDGEILWHAHLDKYDERQELHNMQNYRVLKHPWKGNPQYPPKLVVYSQHCSPDEESPLTAYVSWNGATEQRFWRFSTSKTSSEGPWHSAGTFAREGFETKAFLQGGAFGKKAKFARWTRVEALDGKKQVLGSAVAETFVPSRVNQTQMRCDELHCYEPEYFEYKREMSRAEECRVETSGMERGGMGVWVLVVLGVVFVVYRRLRR